MSELSPSSRKILDSMVAVTIGVLGGTLAISSEYWQAHPLEFIQLYISQDSEFLKKLLVVILGQGSDLSYSLLIFSTLYLTFSVVSLLKREFETKKTIDDEDFVLVLTMGATLSPMTSELISFFMCSQNCPIEANFTRGDFADLAVFFIPIVAILIYTLLRNNRTNESSYQIKQIEAQ